MLNQTWFITLVPRQFDWILKLGDIIHAFYTEARPMDLMRTGTLDEFIKLNTEVWDFGPVSNKSILRPKE